jgi:hypothetical protein
MKLSDGTVLTHAREIMAWIKRQSSAPPASA